MFIVFKYFSLTINVNFFFTSLFFINDTFVDGVLVHSSQTGFLYDVGCIAVVDVVLFYAL